MTKPVSPLLREIIKLTLLFLMGGMIYFIIEVAYKGDSHYSMLITGGLCFLFMEGINSYFDRNMPLIFQMLYSAVIVTLLEFISGVIVNIVFNLNVWDYSNIPFNIMGQICPRFFVIWFMLSLVGIVLDDFLRCRMFGEKMPKYTVFKRRSAA